MNKFDDYNRNLLEKVTINLKGKFVVFTESRSINRADCIQGELGKI